jgi:hypothetical protein
VTIVRVVVALLRQISLADLPKATQWLAVEGLLTGKLSAGSRTRPDNNPPGV